MSRLTAASVLLLLSLPYGLAAPLESDPPSFQLLNASAPAAPIASKTGEVSVQTDPIVKPLAVNDKTGGILTDPIFEITDETALNDFFPSEESPAPNGPSGGFVDIVQQLADLIGSFFRVKPGHMRPHFPIVDSDPEASFKHGAGRPWPMVNGTATGNRTVRLGGRQILRLPVVMPKRVASLTSPLGLLRAARSLGKPAVLTQFQQHFIDLVKTKQTDLKQAIRKLNANEKNHPSKRQIFPKGLHLGLPFDDDAIRVWIATFQDINAATSEMESDYVNEVLEDVESLFADDSSTAPNWEDIDYLEDFEQQVLMYYVQLQTFLVWVRDPAVPYADKVDVWILMFEPEDVPFPLDYVKRREPVWDQQNRLSKRQLFDWSDSDLNFDDAAIRTFITNYHIFEPALEELITTDPDAYFELINGLYSILEDPSSALNWEDNANLGEFEQQLLAYFVQYDTFWIWAQDPTVPLAIRLEVWDLLMEGAAYPSKFPFPPRKRKRSKPVWDDATIHEFVERFHTVNAALEEVDPKDRDDLWNDIAEALADPEFDPYATQLEGFPTEYLTYLLLLQTLFEWAQDPAVPEADITEVSALLNDQDSAHRKRAEPTVFDDTAMRDFVTKWHTVGPAIDHVDPAVVNELLEAMTDPNAGAIWDDKTDLGGFDEVMRKFFVQYFAFAEWLGDSSVPIDDKYQVLLMMFDDSAMKLKLKGRGMGERRMRRGLRQKMQM